MKIKIPPKETRVHFVNGIIKEIDWVLKPGDEVGIFPPIAGGHGRGIAVDVWLSGELARFGGQADQGTFANLKVDLSEDGTISELLESLGIPTEARGITFINGQLSAMPGLQPDLGHILKEGDRVAFFHLRSMWPFQYRFGVATTDEMSEAFHSGDEEGLHHSY